MLTETGLDESCVNSCFFPNNFVINRCDRSPANSRFSRLGGVLISCKNHLKCAEIDLSNFEDIEICCTKISCQFSAIFIVCLYLPPASNLALVRRYLEALIYIDSLVTVRADKLIIFGDFNQPGIDWIPADDDCSHMLPVGISSMVESEVADSLQSMGLFQLNSIMNHQGRSLDLVFVNFLDEVSVLRSNMAAVPEDLYHPSLEIFCCMNSIDCVCDSSYKFDFKNADYGTIFDDLTSHDWSDLLLLKEMDVICREFYCVIFKAIYKSTPVVLVRDVMMDNCPWIGPEIRTLKKSRNRAYTVWRKSSLVSDLAIYKSLKLRLKHLISSSYYSYLMFIQSELKSDPKKFWQFVKTKNKSDGFPNLLEFEGISSDDPLVISNLFASFFQSVYVKSLISPSLSSFDYLPRSFHPIPMNLSFSDDEVLHLLKNLDLNFNAGPDGLSSGFLRKCAVPLHVIVSKMFRISLMTGCFPACWKNSHILPIYKSGKKMKVSNYRGVCIQSSLPKVFDSLMADRLSLVCKQLIVHNQHGFMRKRSTVSNLLEFTDFIMSRFARNGQVDAIYTDFSKAFDKVCHSILLMKLDILGFPVQFTTWLASYLSERTQCVRFRNKLSHAINVTSGVPQGSHIGPLLFILFVNDIVLLLPKCNVLMFADDLKIFMPVHDVLSVSYLQNILSYLCLWCCLNELPLNVNKCTVITFSRSRSPLLFEYFLYGEVLIRSNSVSDLGVILDSKLEFKLHMDHTIAKASKMWGLVRRYAGDFSDPYVIKTLFVSLVRSILEYASIVWSPFYTCHCKRIEAIQKRFIRFALRRLSWVDRFNLPPYCSRLLLLNMRSLSCRRIVSGIVFVFRTVIGEVDAPNLLLRLNVHVPSVTLRSHRFFVIPVSRTNYGGLSGLNGIMNAFNKYYNLIDFHISPVVLKSRLMLLVEDPS